MMQIWTALDPRRRVILIAAALGVFLAVLALARIAAQPGMALLYAGLEPATAGEVVQALDQRGLRYEVRGDSIHVELRLRDEIRMTLAAVGLPRNSAQGYELLDGLSGFGTTSQMFDAAYWRAKEGELSRTISAGPHVRAARVHLAQGSGSGLRRSQPGSASVVVTPAGGGLTPAQAQALRFLVASAVAGLAPEDVAVIDANGGLIGAEDNSGTQAGPDRAAELRRALERMLEATLGPGRAVVEVSLETVTDRETIVERRIDPDSRIVLSQEVEERSLSSTDARPQGVSVASNLPEGDAAGEGRSESRETQSRQRMGYDVSATQREIQRGPGAIRRLTVAVIVDGTRAAGPDGQMQWTPRPEPELESLRALVEAAVGYDAARGDVITLRSLPIEPPGPIAEGVAPGWMTRLGIDAMSMIRLAILALVALGLGAFVLRPLLTRTAVSPERALPRPRDGAARPSGTATAVDLDGPVAAYDFVADTFPPAPRPDPVAAPAPDPVERLRTLIAERRSESVEVLRAWIEDHPEEEPR
jgi:flagellar M-ring protein FliF